MSGRIRTIKPELLEDAITAGLSHVAFRLFIGAILLADDYGNLRFELSWLRGQVFWAREVTIEEFASAVEELTVAREGATEPLISAYIVKAQRYGAIRGWSKHQKVQHPGRPRVPGPPDLTTDDVRDQKPSVPGEEESGMNLSEIPHETFTPDLRSPISDPEGDPDRELTHARTRGVASLEGETEPPRAELEANLDTPIPDTWRARAQAIVARTGIDYGLPGAWAKYVASCLKNRIRLTEAGWTIWAENEAAFAAKRNGRLDDLSWGKLRDSQPSPDAPPYHGGSDVQALRKREEAIAKRPESRAVAAHVAAALAAGDFQGALLPPRKVGS